jgi:hypothetical protein
MNVVAVTVGSVILAIAGVVLGMSLPDSERPNRNGGIGNHSKVAAR